MPIVGGLDIHRKQLTFDCLDTVTGGDARPEASAGMQLAGLRASCRTDRGLDVVRSR